MAKKIAKKSETVACPWETGDLGNSLEHAVKAPLEHGRAIDEAMGLQMISIRLPKALIDDLKYFAEREGLGYQPLMRRVLLRWAAHEYKSIARERLSKAMGSPSASEINGGYEEEIESPRAAVCG